MKTKPKYPPELRERAIHMVYEQREQHASQWSAIESVAEKIGCTPQTLSNWIRKTDGRAAPSATVPDARLKELERENRELRRANEILKLASAFFAQAELDRRLK